MKSLIDSEIPLVDNHSTVYCRIGNKKCKYRDPNFEYDYCSKKSEKIRPQVDYWKAPTWCPLIWEALFPKT